MYLGSKSLLLLCSENLTFQHFLSQLLLSCEIWLLFGLCGNNITDKRQLQKFKLVFKGIWRRICRICGFRFSAPIIRQLMCSLWNQMFLLWSWNVETFGKTSFKWYDKLIVSIRLCQRGSRASNCYVKWSTFVIPCEVGVNEEEDSES